MIAAGALRERVRLERRQEINPDLPNDYGNTVGDWVDQGEIWAGFTHLRGGEAIISGRLQGRHTVVVRVWSSPLTRQVAADWRLIDVRTGVVYAVRDVTPLKDRSGFDILCESGVAA